MIETTTVEVVIETTTVEVLLVSSEIGHNVVIKFNGRVFERSEVFADYDVASMFCDDISRRVMEIAAKHRGTVDAK